MNPNRRRIVLAAGLTPLAALVPGTATAQQIPMPVRDYTVLNPEQPVDTVGKVEVLEFFWYGCPHCYNLQPFMEKWVKTLPADAVLRQVPAIFNERWARDAATFYTFEALGVLARVHRPFFDAIHRDRLKTDDPAALTAWLRKQGIEVKKFDEATKSFGVQSKVRRAAQLTRAYRIEGTPTLAVHGRYTISAEQGGSQAGMLASTDHLIGLARKSLAGKK